MEGEAVPEESFVPIKKRATFCPLCVRDEHRSLPCHTQHLYCVQSLDFILFQTLIWVYPDAFCVCGNVPFLVHWLSSVCRTGSNGHVLSARKGNRLCAILLY